jgi:RimJ/RimL family protein N-acetyltransferase
VEVILETPRLLLRPLRSSDLDAYARMSADPEVMRYIGTGGTLHRDAAWRSMAAMLGHWQLLGYGMWAVEAKDSGELKVYEARRDERP